MFNVTATARLVDVYASTEKAERETEENVQEREECIYIFTTER